jgi:excisionase family DNA binding protein
MRKRRTSEMEPQQKKLLTVEEAAQVLSLGRTFFYNLLRCNEIASVKIGRCRRVPFEALEAYVAAQVGQDVITGRFDDGSTWE